MNVNVENAPSVRLRAEFTEPSLDHLGKSQSESIRAQIDQAEIHFTKVTKFDVKVSGSFSTMNVFCCSNQNEF